MATFSENTGNLLEADVDALVNTVNTVGVMGKGIALQFKNAFPANFEAYRRACKDEAVQLGEMFVFELGAGESDLPDDSRSTMFDFELEPPSGPRWIINFPTKAHWRSRTSLGHIASGLDDLRRTIQEQGIESIAVPALGCGNGGLDWGDVGPLIRERLRELDAHVCLYPPAGAPAASEMAVNTERPVLTPGKAAMVAMVERYSAVAFSTSLIEIQKLMYFLQEAGEDLRLGFIDHYFGPYADNLRHVLKALEGHYLRGFGDGSNPVEHSEPVVVLTGAADEAAGVLANHPEVESRMHRVLEVVEGFESPFGLELLASVHWAATRIDWGPDDAPATVAQRVMAWSARKRRLFSADHITTAWERLRDQRWIGPIPAAN
ncbi:MAG: macro domain-containing protein [bacterium]|nr:macro domain-containing protein [bacterium]